MSAADARQVLRTLLRAVDRSITPATGNRQWRQYVLTEFRRAEAQDDPAERQRALQDARDYAFLINSVREHKASVWAPAGLVPCCRRCRRCLRPAAAGVCRRLSAPRPVFLLLG